MVMRFKGRPVYVFLFDDVKIYVTRGNAFLAASVEDTPLMGVIVPPGMSYKQGVLQAYNRIKKGTLH